MAGKDAIPERLAFRLKERNIGLFRPKVDSLHLNIVTVLLIIIPTPFSPWTLFSEFDATSSVLGNREKICLPLRVWWRFERWLF